MRQLKLLGLVGVAVCLLAIAGASAQGAELKLLPEGLKFSFTNSGLTELETLSGKKVTCLGLTGKGEGLSERLGDVEFKFTDCGTLKETVKCSGLGEPEGVITVKGSYHIRHLLPASAGVNIAVLVEAAHFSCLGVLFVVKGCVASMDILTKEGGVSAVNLLLMSGFVEFLQEKGEQSPTSIDKDNGLEMEECVLKSKEGANAEETAGQLGKGTIEKCEKAGTCTVLIDLSGTA